MSKIVGVSTDLFSGKYILLVGDEEFGLNPTCAVRTVLGETEFNSLKEHYDVFVRSDIADEVILDAIAFGEDEVVALGEVTGIDGNEFAGQYAVFVLNY